MIFKTKIAMNPRTLLCVILSAFASASQAELAIPDWFVVTPVELDYNDRVTTVMFFGEGPVGVNANCTVEWSIDYFPVDSKGVIYWKFPVESAKGAIDAYTHHDYYEVKGSTMVARILIRPVLDSECSNAKEMRSSLNVLHCSQSLYDASSDTTRSLGVCFNPREYSFSIPVTPK